MITRAQYYFYHRYTRFGIWASLTSLLFVFSISAEFRLNLAGLLVHPYLLLLPIAIVFTGLSLQTFPRATWYYMLLFFVFFSLGSLQNDNPISEILKVGASLATFVFFVQSVKTEKDFRRISWGFVAVAVTIGIMGFVAGESATGEGARLSGINVLEGIGNKNAQSLFTLPGLFLAMNLAFYYLRARRWLIAGMIVCCIFFIIVQIFLSANRSGWVGMFVVFLSYLVISGINIRALLLSGLVVIFTYVAIDQYAEDVFERKRTQTVEGYSSDIGRRMLIRESILVGLENPLFGVGFEPLNRQLATRLGLNRFGAEQIDTHFLIGYIFGATGIFSLAFFLLFLKSLCTRRFRWRKANRVLRQSWLMLVTFVFLFVVRSLFTREILYSPTFVGCMGLLYGYYLIYRRNVTVLFSR
jgi:hypothetical protein